MPRARRRDDKTTFVGEFSKEGPTEYFELKSNAIMKHKSQNPNRFVELAKLMNSYRAGQCNAPIGVFAEAYFFERSFPFVDISNILPSSLDLRPFHIKNVNRISTTFVYLPFIFTLSHHDIINDILII